MKLDLRPWGESVLDVLFPPTCVACRALGPEPFCAVCATGVETAPPVTVVGIDRTVAIWAYQGPVARALQRLKYRSALDVARPLGVALAAATHAIEVDVVVPLPLSERRLIERGYNQARELVRSQPRPVVVHALRRLHDGPSQVGRARVERLENLRGAFCANPRWVAKQRILLVDDVVTTGATAEAAAVALRAAGAHSVTLAVVAATPLESSHCDQTTE